MYLPLRLLEERIDVLHEPMCRHSLARLVMRGTDAPWALGEAPENDLQRQLRGVVGIALAITRLEGKWKVNQNRHRADRVSVVSGLAERFDANDRAMAGLVETMDQEQAKERDL